MKKRIVVSLLSAVFVAGNVSMHSKPDYFHGKQMPIEPKRVKKGSSKETNAEQRPVTYYVNKQAVQVAPLVRGEYSNINSCQVIYHDGSSNFTYGNAGQDEGASGTNSYGSTKTLNNYKGYELCCKVNLDHLAGELTTVSLPVSLSDFSVDIQKALNPIVSITDVKQINGRLAIERDNLALIPSSK